MQNNILEMKMAWHIKVATLPRNIQRAVKTLFRENGIPTTYAHSSLRWEVSSETFEVCVSDKDHDEAANTVNNYFTKESTPTLADGLIIYFDL